MKLYIHGKEMLNTSIDMDNAYLKKHLADMGHDIIDNIDTADAIFSVWWNSTPKTDKLTFIYLSNFIKTEDSEKIKIFLEIENKIKPIWICPSKKQQNVILKYTKRERTKFIPFFVNDIYYKTDINKIDIIASFAKNKLLTCSLKENIKSIEDLKACLDNKIKIGSFQRDSEGSNLLKPKWQKGPDNLIKWAKDSKYKNEIVFFIAGPRRHYIISKLISEDMSFVYFGNPNYINLKIDDISVNTFPESIIFNLYNSVDCYAIGSNMEGGPKAAIECAMTKIPVISTDVGLSSHFIHEDYIKKSINSADFDMFLSDVKSAKYKYKTSFPGLDYNLNKLEELLR